MKKVVFLLSLSILSFGKVSAQELKHPKYKISQVQISMGSDRSFAPMNFTQEEFSALAPGAQLPATSLLNQNQFGWEAAVFNINVAMHPLMKNGNAGQYNANRLIRGGISVQGINSSIYHTSSTTTFRIDTLMSATNGSIYVYVDSVHHNFSHCNYISTAVKLDFSYLASTDASKRFSYYTGMGLTFGLTLAPRTEIQSESWGSERVTDTNGNNIQGQDLSRAFSVNHETHSNNIGYMSSLYVPMGIDFRLKKKNEVAKQIHLFFEMRPTVSALTIPETRTYVYPSLQNCIGIKFTW